MPEENLEEEPELLEIVKGWLPPQTVDWQLPNPQKIAMSAVDALEQLPLGYIEILERVQDMKAVGSHSLHKLSGPPGDKISRDMFRYLAGMLLSAFSTEELISIQNWAQSELEDAKSRKTSIQENQ